MAVLRRSKLVQCIIQYDIPSEVAPPPEVTASRRWYASRSRSRSTSRPRHPGDPSASRRLSQARSSRSTSPSSRSRSISWSPSGRSRPSLRYRQQELTLTTEAGTSRGAFNYADRALSPNRHRVAKDVTPTSSVSSGSQRCHGASHDGGVRTHSASDVEGKGKGKAPARDDALISHGIQIHSVDHEGDREQSRDAANVHSLQHAGATGSKAGEEANRADSHIVTDEDTKAMSVGDERKDLTAESSTQLSEPKMTALTASTISSDRPQARHHERARRAPRNLNLLESVQAYLVPQAKSSSRDQRPTTFTSRKSLLARLSDSQPDPFNTEFPDTAADDDELDEHNVPSRLAGSESHDTNIPLSSPNQSRTNRSGMSAVQIMARTRARLAKSGARAASQTCSTQNSTILPSSIEAKPPSTSHRALGRAQVEGRSDDNDNPLIPCEPSAHFGSGARTLGESSQISGSTMNHVEKSSSDSDRPVEENGERLGTLRAKLLSKLADEKHLVQQKNNAPSASPSGSSSLMEPPSTPGAQILRDDVSAREAALRNRARLKVRLANAKKGIQKEDVPPTE